MSAMQGISGKATDCMPAVCIILRGMNTPYLWRQWSIREFYWSHACCMYHSRENEHTIPPEAVDAVEMAGTGKRRAAAAIFCFASSASFARCSACAAAYWACHAHQPPYEMMQLMDVDCPGAFAAILMLATYADMHRCFLGAIFINIHIICKNVC